MGRMYTSMQFARHLLRSKRWDAFHSPYLYKLFMHCCEDRIRPPVFSAIEISRKQFLSSSEIISRRDYGAGSAFQHKEEQVQVSHVARSALSFPFQCRFMSRLAGFSNARHVLELGTSLGVSAAYYAAGNPGIQINTVEGDPAVAAIASGLIQSLNLKNVYIHCETFERFISGYASSLAPIDLLFLDGNHQLEATIQYYQALKSHFHSGTIVIVDDIYWSAEMNACWNKMISFPEVTQSVDCFHFGLLFHNPDFLNQENHQVRLPLRMLLT